MPDSLLIRLPARADPSTPIGPVASMVVDGAGHQVEPPVTASLASIAPRIGQRRVIVIVPGADVLSLDAELPPLSGPRLLQAVPFAVEEQVAEDVETLHFAAGPRAPSGRTAVEVISRGLLSGWLEELASAGIMPQAMYADTALLPRASGQAIALLESADLAIRIDDRPVVRLPARPFADAIALAFATDAEAVLPPVTLYATPADWEAVRPEVEPLQPRFAQLKVQLLPSGPLPLLAPRAVGALGGAPPINLLQGVFAPRSRPFADWRPWRLAAALGMLALVMHLTALGLEYQRLRSSERALDAAIAELVQRTLPGDASAEEARRRIEQQLLAVRAGRGGGGPWLPALAALAQARTAAPEAELESVGLDSGAVNVRVRAATAESLERISAALRASGWQAELQAGSASPNAYEGRIRLRLAGGDS